MKKIPLSGRKHTGMFALVDDEDYENLSRWKWSVKMGAGNTPYAQRNGKKGVDEKKTVYMHVEIGKTMQGYQEGYVINHIDRNGLNNCRSNLEPTTNRENLLSQAKTSKKTSSKYKGVDWYSPTAKWRARIRCNYVQIYLGYYVLEEDAAKAYNEAARRLFGAKAALNPV